MWLLFSIKNWRIIIIYLKIQKILQDKNIFDKKRAEESKKDKMVSTNFYEDRKIVFISDNTKYVSLSVKNSWANSFLSLFRNVLSHLMILRILYWENIRGMAVDLFCLIYSTWDNIMPLNLFFFLNENFCNI